MILLPPSLTHLCKRWDLQIYYIPNLFCNPGVDHRENTVTFFVYVIYYAWEPFMLWRQLKVWIFACWSSPAARTDVLTVLGEPASQADDLERASKPISETWRPTWTGRCGLLACLSEDEMNLRNPLSHSHLLKEAAKDISGHVGSFTFCHGTLILWPQ